MNVSPVAYRYARSLMELSKGEGTLKGTLEDMEMVSATARGNRELITLLKSPVVKGDRKSRILEQIFVGKIGTITAKFMEIMVRKGREALLPEVAQAFTRLYRIEKGIIMVEVRSAAPLTDDAREKVRDLAEKKNPGKTIELEETVDRELIGGVVIRIGDDQYDGSVARRLQDLRRNFSQNPYIPEI